MKKIEKNCGILKILQKDKMPTTYVNWSVQGDFNRNDLRREVINKFIGETPGKGKGHLTSKYVYYVETLATGDRVYLTRPVPLNKGFDFIVHVENHTFMNGKTNPKHDDLFDDLRLKKQNNPTEFTKLIKAIEEIADCKDVDQVLQNSNINFNVGFSVEMILKVVKWLFIEQDIRYWNWSGKFMFLDHIKKI